LKALFTLIDANNFSLTFIQWTRVTLTLAQMRTGGVCLKSAAWDASLFLNMVRQWCLFCVLETGSHFLAQASFKLTILLPWPPKCWDYSCVPPCLARVF
jgi:hypothetical protein